MRMKRENLNKDLKSGISFLLFVMMLGFAAGLTGCGGTSLEEELGNPQDLGGPGDPPPGDPPPGDPPPGEDPPIMMEYSLTGPDGSEPEFHSNSIDDIYTDTTLRVSFRPNTTIDLFNSGHNFTWEQACARYKVTVNGVTKTTPVMKLSDYINYWNYYWQRFIPSPNNMCPNAPTTVELNFDGATGGPGPYDIKVFEAKNDWKCAVGSGSCGSPGDVYHNHVTSGTMCVQTDGAYDCSYEL